MKKNYIEFKNITKKFGDFVVLDDVSLSISEGEFFVLLGESGCGKTTLMRMLAGFETPTAGTIYLDGNDITDEEPNNLPVNMVFQSYALFPTMNVFDNVSYGLKIRKENKQDIKKKVGDVLSVVGLAEFAHRMPHELSGGQRQRVSLARALVLKPKVLLLDEPMSALDAKLRGAMRVELVRLQKKVGITFVMVTHDQEEALSMADRIAILHDTKVMQMGKPSEIYENPQGHFVADFIGRANILDAKVLKTTAKFVEVEVEYFGKMKVPLDNTKDFEAGEAVKWILRPEKLMVSLRKRDYDYSIKGTMESVNYYGSDTEIIVKLKGGYLITGIRHNPNRRPDEDYKLGGSAYVSFDAEDVNIVKNDK